MSDLIERQAAIEVIDAVFPVDPMKSEYAQGILNFEAWVKEKGNSHERKI